MEKKKVYYAVLEKMEQYIPDFCRDEYERSFSGTDEEVLAYLKEYYNNNLPVDIDAWAAVNIPLQKEICGKSYFHDQVSFVKGPLKYLIEATIEQYESFLPMVISTHFSKLVLLPVYKLHYENYNLNMVIKSDFYNWQISIDSEIPILCDFMGLFDGNKKIDESWFYGFPKEWIFENFEKNKSKFSLELRNNYELYTFMFLINNYLKNNEKNKTE